MRTVIGGIFLTIGCLMGFGTIVGIGGAAGLLPVSSRSDATAYSGLVACMFAGWMGFGLILGVVVLRGRSRHAAHHIAILMATIIVGIAAFIYYVWFEVPNAQYERPHEMQKEVRYPAFGMVFVDEKDDNRTANDYKYLMWMMGVGVLYVTLGGIAGGLVSTACIRLVKGREDSEAINYKEPR